MNGDEESTIKKQEDSKTEEDKKMWEDENMKTDKEINGDEDSTIKKQEDSKTEEDDTGDIAGMKKETMVRPWRQEMQKMQQKPKQRT